MVRPLSNEWSVKLGYSIDPMLVSNLMYWRNMALHHDGDAAIVIDGKEGSGKSVLALQVGKFMDRENTLDLDTQVHFDADSVRKAAKTLPKGKVIIYDESGESMDVSLASSKKQREIKQLFKECRQQNLIFILVLPSFFDLQRFFAIHRTRALLHVYYEKNPNAETDEEKYFRRGKYLFYNEDGKRMLYTTDKCRRHYMYPTRWDNEDLSIFTGKFSGAYPIDEVAYRKKKRDASKALQDEEEEKVVKVDWREEVVRVMVRLQGKRMVKYGWIKATGGIIERSPTWMSERVKKYAQGMNGEVTRLIEEPAVDVESTESLVDVTSTEFSGAALPILSPNQGGRQTPEKNNSEE